MCIRDRALIFLMIRRPPRSTLSSSSAASDVYKRQVNIMDIFWFNTQKCLWIINRSQTYLGWVFIKQRLQWIHDQLAESTFILVSHFMCLQWTYLHCIPTNNVINCVGVADRERRILTESKLMTTCICVLSTQTMTKVMCQIAESLSSFVLWVCGS